MKTATLIWTAGVTPAPVLTDLACKKEKGRLVCRVMSRCSHSFPSVCPLLLNNSSSSFRRLGSASALNTSSMTRRRYATDGLHVKQHLEVYSLKRKSFDRFRGLQPALRLTHRAHRQCRRCARRCRRPVVHTNHAQRLQSHPAWRIRSSLKITSIATTCVMPAAIRKFVERFSDRS